MTNDPIVCDQLNKVFAGSRSRVARFLLNKPLQDIHAVKDVSFSVKAGEILGVMGPNGAGKTTLVKLLCTLLTPTSGTASILGADIASQPDSVRQQIAFITGDERSFYWRLTGRQNVQFFAGLLGLKQPEAQHKIESLAETLGLSPILDKRFDSYSTGNRQKLAVLRGLLNDASVLFLDEPTRSLDPASALTLTRLIRDDIARARGRSVLFVTHRLDEAQSTCDRLLIMKDGEIVFLGEPDALQDREPTQNWKLRICGNSQEAVRQLNQLPDTTSSVYHTNSHPDNDQLQPEIIIETHLESGGELVLGDLAATVAAAGCRLIDATKVVRPAGEMFAELTEDAEPPS